MTPRAKTSPGDQERGKHVLQRTAEMKWELWREQKEEAAWRKEKIPPHKVLWFFY